MQMGRELSRPAGWAERPQLWGAGREEKQATGAVRALDSGLGKFRLKEALLWFCWLSPFLEHLQRWHLRGASPSFPVGVPCSTEPGIWTCCGRRHGFPARSFVNSPLPWERGCPPSLRSPQQGLGPVGSWGQADSPGPAWVAWMVPELRARTVL